MNDLDTNSLICRMFMSATLDAAVHLGKGYLENLHITNSQAQRTIKQLFDLSQKLITDQTEIQGLPETGWYYPWRKTPMLTERAVQISTAKVQVFSDSVLCLGKMNPHPESIEWFTGTPQYRELDRIDGEPMEFEW